MSFSIIFVIYQVVPEIKIKLIPILFLMLPLHVCSLQPDTQHHTAVASKEK